MTLEELADLPYDPRWDALLKKIRSAIVKKSALVIDSPTPPQTRLAWAKAAAAAPTEAADALKWYVIGATAVDVPTLTENQLFTAADDAIETRIGTAVDALYTT